MKSQNEYPVTHDVVLVGGGHSHVEVIRQFAMKVEPGVRLTLVSRDVHTPYSGMLPGLLAGHYSFDEAHINLHRLCRAAGVRFIHAQVDAVDTSVNRLSLKQRTKVGGIRPHISYDVVSFDTGSSPITSGIEGADGAIAVKPVELFRKQWTEFERKLTQHESARVTVVGSGAGGVELAMSLEHRSRQQRSAQAKLRFTICGASAEILSGHHPSVRGHFKRALAQRGFEIHNSARVTRIENNNCVTSDGQSFDGDAVILVTGAQSADWYSESDLDTDERGFVLVRDSLQSTSHDNVFASGDCATLNSQRLPKAGVYAVRQGAVVARNLRALVRGEKLEDFNPQARILALISTGDHYAVASRGSFCVAGGWVWRWKNWIDRRWMQRYQQFEMPQAPLPVISRPASAEQVEMTSMRCGGCGAKVPASTLRKVLARITDVSDSDDGVSIGLSAADDAAVLDVPNGYQLVQSVDHFRSFIDDPWQFAFITTNHCLNDLFAMGATPHSALATAIVPYGAARPVGSELEALLSGAVEGLKAAGASLAGGHSAEGAELSFGLSVNGLIKPQDVLNKSGWQHGDCLILTKALGTGIVLAADMRGKADPDVLAAALATMQQSNAAAVEIFRRHGVHACTDITGFGLYGHCLEMSRGANAGAALDLRALPLLPGAVQLLDSGFASTLAPSNRALLTGVAIESETVAPGLRDIVFDPQTAGGLLAAIPKAQAASCVQHLRDAGLVDAVQIGEVRDSISGIEFAG